MKPEIQLRDVVERDFPFFFELQSDPAAARMAAFGTRDPDPAAHAARWGKSLAGGTTTQKAIVEIGGNVLGFVATFVHDGKLQVTYWIARSHWGHGIASTALDLLLRSVAVRPIYASAAKDNVGSLRVLEKCGFAVRGSERAFANARNEEVEEVFLVLR